MSAGPCPFEREVVRALQSDRIDESLQTHMEHCTECRDTRLVAGLLLGAATEAAETTRLPHPALLLLKAQQRRRVQEQQAATRAIGWVARVAPVPMTVTLAALVWWNAGWLTQWAGPLGPLPAPVFVGLLAGMAVTLWTLVQLSLYRLVEE